MLRSLHVALVLAFLPVLSSPAWAATALSRDVAFTRGGVTLAGTLFEPQTPGTHPAMVMMPGSGPETRAPLLELAQRFAEAGVVTLAYDKQGTGKSGGDWTAEDLDDLAGDAWAGIRFLSNLPDVDASRVGAWGISQSGWVMPRLARLDPNLPFMVVVTGGGATPRQVEYLGYHAELLHSGFDEEDWTAAKPLVDRYMDYLASGIGREALLKAIRDAKDQRWSGALGLERVIPDDASRAKWAWVPSYDPADDIRGLHMPVLVLLGGKDPFTPSGEALKAWHEALAQTSNPLDKVISYPSAGHGIRTNGHDMRAAPVYAPGYVEDQLLWLRLVGALPDQK